LDELLEFLSEDRDGVHWKMEGCIDHEGSVVDKCDFLKVGRDGAVWGGGCKALGVHGLEAIPHWGTDCVP
jgi:hypothetical protein